MTFTDLLARPMPTWLIEGLLQRGSFGVLWGLPEVCKTFVALSMALAVAVGETWFGRRTLQGAVVYVAAEGDLGIVLRVRAWADDRSVEIEKRLTPSFFVVGQPVAFLEQEEEHLLSAIAELQITPVLVVIDTVSRCLAGGDENSSREMSRFVSACDRIRFATGAAVLVVHHADKAGKAPRGSSVLHGAATSMMHVLRGKDGVIHLVNEKQKDAPHHPSMAFDLVTVQVGEEEGETSCRLALREGGESAWSILRPATRRVCKVLRIRDDAKGVTIAELVAATTYKQKTVYNATSEAVTAGYARQVPRSNPHRFVATQRLRDLPSPDSSLFSERSPEPTRDSSPPPSPSSRGEGEGRARRSADRRVSDAGGGAS